jgi:hypothetical protein
MSVEETQLRPHIRLAFDPSHWVLNRADMQTPSLVMEKRLMRQKRFFCSFCTPKLISQQQKEKRFAFFKRLDRARAVPL